VKGIEPSYAAWEAAVLPLNYTRKDFNLAVTIVPLPPSCWQASEVSRYAASGFTPRGTDMSATGTFPFLTPLPKCLLLLGTLVFVTNLLAQAPIPDPGTYVERQKSFSAQMEARGLAEEFKGITTDGSLDSGLFPLRSTGVSTASIQEAASGFLQSLSLEQRALTQFPMDDDEWRKWGNQHIYYRQGLSFEAMEDTQRTAAWALLDAALSAKGLELARDIMRLNETLGELNNNNNVEYGEGKYWLTLMGEPSAEQPWGWQLDGHHLVLNYVVVGDQVVMTPAFWGSEPAVASSGKYAGTRIMAAEQQKGLAVARSLDTRQRNEAVLASPKTGNNMLGQAFTDNIIVPYAGISVNRFTAEQKSLLIDLIAEYTGNMEDGHADVALADITARFDETWFAWVGDMADDSVFYYRIHSPVILIEFDHQTPVGLGHLYPRGVPFLEHIHAVVRTPNGNDYGKDLLRQHYERFPH